MGNVYLRNNISRIKSLSTPNKAVKEFKQVTNNAIPATTGIEKTVIKPTKGKIGKIKHIGFYIFSIAGSTGNHLMSINIGDSIQYTAEKAYELSVAGTAVLQHNPSANPTSLINLTFTEDKPLVITYSNTTNTAHTFTRMVKALYEEEDLV